MKRLRIDIDSSVFGGCFDKEFEDESRRFFELAKASKIILLISNVTLAELERAPKNVQEVAASISPENVERLEGAEEAERLRDAYLAARVVPPKFAGDALHVAMATIEGADLIVSWNFKHLVNIQRIRAFNAVNLLEGYQSIDIRSPLEVLG